MKPIGPTTLEQLHSQSEKGQTNTETNEITDKPKNCMPPYYRIRGLKIAV